MADYTKYNNSNGQTSTFFNRELDIIPVRLA